MNQTAELGGTVILTCNATGIPEPTISWVRAPKMEEIVGRENSNINLFCLIFFLEYQILGSIFTIKRIANVDEGFYHCIAKNEAGQAIGVRKIDVNSNILDSFIKILDPLNKYKKIWVECDKNGYPVKDTFRTARGDTPQTEEKFLPWNTDRQELLPNGTNGILYNCLPLQRGPRRVPRNTMPYFVETPLNTVVNMGAELRLHCRCFLKALTFLNI